MTNANGGMNFAGVVILQNRTLNLNAGAVQTAGFISHGQGAVINLPASQTFDMQGDFGFSFGQGGTRGMFNNSGTFTKSGGAGIADLDMTFLHSGIALNVNSGTLRFLAGFTGTAPINVAATLDLASGTHDFNSGTLISGAGTVLLRATENFNAGSSITTVAQLQSGTSTFNTGATVSLPTFTHSGGTLTGADTVTVLGTYTWSGGTLTGGGMTNANGGMNFAGVVILQNRTLNLNAGAVQTAGFISHGQGAVINVPASQTFDMQGDFGFSFGQGGTRGMFNNSGTFTKSGGASIADVDMTFLHSGAAVNVNSGTLRILAGFTSTTPINVAGVLDLNTGTHDFNAGTVISGAGTVALRSTENFSAGSSITTITQLSSGTTTFNTGATVTLPTFTHSGGTLTGADTFTVTGIYTWSGGTLTGGGMTNPNGGMNFAGVVILQNRTVNLNAGAVQAAGFISHGQGAVINLPASQTFDMQGDFGFSFGQGGTRGTFNSAGTFIKTAGTGSATLDVTFSNTGTLAVAVGTLLVNAPFTQTAGVTRLNGGALQTTVALNFNGGVLEGVDGSAITGTGSVNNAAGAVSPGLTPGALNIGNSYTQGASGSLNIEIGGLTPGTQHDQLNVTNAATLSGTLNVTLTGGFTPASGDSFTILTAGAVSGTFIATNFPALPGGMAWSITLNPTSVVLSVGGPPQADLGVTKADAPDPALVGQPLVYTLTVSNSGPNTATGATLTDTLPANVVFNSATATQGSCTETGGVVTCSLGAINSGSNATVTINVTPQAAAAGTTLTNNASVTATEIDPNAANDSAVATTMVSPATFFGPLAYTCQNDSPFFAGILAGNILLETFEDGLFNVTGAAASTGSVLGPGGLTDSVDCDDGVVDGSGTNGRSFFAGSGATGITFTFSAAVLGSLPTQVGIAWTDGSGTISFEAFDAVGASLGVVTGNHADGSVSGTTGEDRFYGVMNAGGISAIRIRNTSGGIEVDHLQFGPVASADLTLTKADTPDPITIGMGNLTYTLNVSNAGPDPATNVVLTDVLPAGMTFVSATPSQGTCTGTATVVCNLGMIAVGSGASVVIDVTPTSAGMFTNMASVAGAEGDPNPADNSAMATTTVMAFADLSVSKADSPDPVIAGTNLTYTITVANAGPNAATSTTLSDTLPASVLFVSATPSQGTCTGTATVTCTLGTIASGNAAMVTIVVTPQAAGTISNTVTVASAATDNNLADNSFTEMTTVNAVTDLAMAKMDTPDPVVGGANLVYTLTATNLGPSPATGVVITDTLPAGVTFFSASSACAHLTGVVTCTIGALGSGASSMVTIAVTTAQSAATTMITNNASVTGAEPDPSLANNSAAETTTVLAGPLVTLSTTSVVFAGQLVGTTSPAQQVTVSNTGNSPLAFTSITISGDFAQTNNCGTSLAAGSSCVIGITFSPASTGARMGMLTITDNAPGSPHTVALSGTGILASAITLSTSSVLFGSFPINTTSPPQTVTLTNSGNAVLNISSITLTGEFAQTNNCGITVAVGASCTITVTFTPLGSGLRTGAITITSDARGSVPSITLTGTGSAPGVMLSSNLLVFAAQPVGTTSSALTVTLTNNGAAALNITSIVAGGDFAQSNNCGTSVAVGANCTISVTFTPSQAGTISGTLTITDSGVGSPRVVGLSGTGVAAVASINPLLLTFLDQPVSTTSGAQMVTVTNTGGTALLISSIVVAGNFAQTNNCGGMVAPGASCVISVTFTPTTTGVLTGTVTLTTNAAGSPHVINLTGTAITSGAAVALAPGSITFAAQILGTTSAPQNVTLMNSGNAVLTITGITITGDFAQTNNCGMNLPAGTSCTFQVTFSPLVAGTRAGQLSVSHDAAGSPHVVALSGAGVTPGPIAALSSTSLTFAARNVNTTSAAQPVTLTNTGNAVLNISSIAVTGDFAQTNNCGATLAVSVSCTISVTFTPTVSGARAGAVTITTDAPGSPHTVGLSGSGTAFTITLPSGNSSVTIAPGQTATFNLTFTPEGGFSETVTVTCTGAPAGATCTAAPSSFLLSVQTSVTVSFTTTAGAFTSPPVGTLRWPPAALPRWELTAFTLLLGCLLLWITVRMPRRRASFAALAVVLLVIGLGSCAGGTQAPAFRPPSGTAPGTYNLTVTASSASGASRTMMFTVTVR
jgi:uncharacterized repeat protein (TIGR01451 family)